VSSGPLKHGEATKQTAKKMNNTRMDVFGMAFSPSLFKLIIQLLGYN
jgi:hypothetical protein